MFPVVNVPLRYQQRTPNTCFLEQNMQGKMKLEEVFAERAFQTADPRKFTVPPLNQQFQTEKAKLKASGWSIRARYWRQNERTSRSYSHLNIRAVRELINSSGRFSQYVRTPVGPVNVARGKFCLLVSAKQFPSPGYIPWLCSLMAGR